MPSPDAHAPSSSLTTPAPSAPPEPIALIGIGCRLPGRAQSPDALWQLLCDGVDTIGDVPADRWSIPTFYDPAPGTPGKTYARWGGFIDGIDQFDALFFGISPREAAAMDPQHRLLLEVAYEALEDGGQTLTQLAGSPTGVFIGISAHDYSGLQSTVEDRSAINAYTPTGAALSIAANRLSYCFDLQGPSLAVDTACSSALVAVHLACRSLWDGESTLAIAGGVNIIIAPETFIGFSQASMLSPDGRCKAFDASGNGFVRSEGVGVVVLKPLAQALADGDPIYALIRGTAVNQDGRTTGIALPSQTAQIAMLREAYRHAGVAPGQVQYVEAHGTGTAVGDPIEAQALGTVLSTQRPDGRVCFMGSVKTNIGHMEAGAGIVGLIKTALALRYGAIPPHLHLREPNPRIPFAALKLRLPQRLEPWPETDGGPRLAGVNAFGFGGTNAHIVMSDAPPAALPPADDAPELPVLLPFTAHSPAALTALAQTYVTWLHGPVGATCTMAALADNLSRRRTQHAHRLAVVARNTGELLSHLQAFGAGETRPDLRVGHAVSGSRPRLAWVFGGQGPQWWAMGRQLLAQEPVFREVITTCDTLLQPQAPWSLLAELTAEDAHSRLHETAIAQPALFAVQVALAALWRSWGVEPDAVVGHSVGEIAAAYVAGVFDLATALHVIYHRGRCMERASSHGSMLGAGITPDEAVALLAPYAEQVSLAAINSPTSVTFSGDATALHAMAETLAQRQMFHSVLRVQYAFHSVQMEPVRTDLLAALSDLQPQAATLPMISTVTGHAVAGPELGAAYWWQNVRQAVRFGPALGQLIEQSYGLFVEVSPHPVLAGYVTECLQAAGQSGQVLPSLRRQEAERVQMLRSLGALYTAGVPVAWGALSPQRQQPLALPRYPWQHEAYWHEAEGSRVARLGTTVHPLLGRRLALAAPVWQAVVNRIAFPYLWEHRVQGRPVFPAAGYFEMALALTRMTWGAGTLILEDFALHNALFLPEDGTDALLQTHLDATEGSYTISGRLHGTETAWTRLASGKARVEPPGAHAVLTDLDQVRQRCPEEVPPALCYQHAQAHGLQYGPLFQGVTRLWRTTDEALGQIELPESLHADAEAYLFHPALLDACWHVALETLAPTDRTVYLPVSSAQIRYYGRPGPQLWSYARRLSYDAKNMAAQLSVSDAQGQIVIEFRRSSSRAIEAAQDDRMDRWLYAEHWQVKPRAGATSPQLAVDFVPASVTLEAALQAEAQHLHGHLGFGAHYADMKPGGDQLCAAYIAQACRDLGWDMTPGESVTAETLAARLGIVPRYLRLWRRYLDILTQDGWLRAVEGAWVVQGTPPHLNAAPLWQDLLQRFPAFTAELMFTGRCGTHLAAVLQGTMDPIQLHFPDGSFATAEHFYQDSPSFKLYNLLVAKAVELALAQLPAGRHVRLLELGAGTAGMTSYVLPRLPVGQVSYALTDVSPLFLQRAATKVRDYPFVTTHRLDIEHDPVDQGFAAQTFDIVLASDVLHATRDLCQTLAHIQQLLAPGGLLIVLEVENPGRLLGDIGFGVLEGWWRFADADVRPSSPLLPWPQWAALLQATGFTQPLMVSDLAVLDGERQMVFLARAPQVQRHVPPQLPGPVPVPRRQRWLILADHGGVGQQVAHWLHARGEASLLVFAGESPRRRDDGHVDVCPDSREAMQWLWREVVANDPAGWQGVVHCWSCDAPPSAMTTVAMLAQATAHGCHSLMHLMQVWAADALTSHPRLWLVTRGAQPVLLNGARMEVTAAAFCGLGRVVQHEHPELHCVLVDLSPAVTAHDITALGEELLQGDDEGEVALRGTVRYVPRVVRTSLRRFAPHETPRVAIPSTPVRVEIGTPGVLESLIFRDTPRRPPGPGEVEIQVQAAALNFRDVLKAMGLYPTDIDASGRLGDECAGSVVAVGEGVTEVHVGDAVVALAPGSLSTFVTTHAALTMPKPDWLGWNEAATLPIVFLTAYYALHHVGRLSPGERILIHAATGGVGLAAVQLAQQAGAEIFATAGSAEKRLFLRDLGIRQVMDSRSLAFVDDIHASTRGAGVDLVLNALAGDAITQGLACLAPYGRFLEIGVRDIYQNRQLSLRVFANSLSFCAINLAHAMTQRPQLIRTLLRQVMQGVTERRLHPLPYRAFPLGEAAQALRHMAQARHVGKVVLTMHAQHVPVTPRVDTPYTCTASGTYLITGGLSAFGLVVAQWLVERGARHLVLMGRSGAATVAAQEAVQHLERQGVRVLVACGDVADEEDVRRVLDTIEQTLPPLRGVLHAAVVYDNGIVLQLDQERFEKVMAPKAYGAWNLHRLTQHLPLDCFVLFASMVSMLGSPGQGNYVAANAFLDALAHYRHAHGLPALTVSLGPLTDVGYVARNPHLHAHLDNLGFRGFPSTQALDICGLLLARRLTHVGVTPMDWQQWGQAMVGRLSPRFTSLIQATLQGENGSDQATPRDVVLTAAPAERLRVLETCVTEHVARVLGMSPTAVDAERALTEMGLDSLMAVELKSRMEHALGLTLPIVELLRGPSIRQLSQLLLVQFTGEEATERPAVDTPLPPPATQDSTPAALIEQVEHLSEQEVDALLSGLDDSALERLLAQGAADPTTGAHHD